MHNNSIFKSLLFLVSILLFVSCDKEYSAIGDALIGENHFELAKYNSSVIAYNEKITPIQSSNLPINALGIYDNPAFGKTTANFVTQLSLVNVNPTFGPNAVIDSVVVDVPYFSTLKSTNATTGNSEYELDSIYGEPKAKIKLSVYESNRYMGKQNGVDQIFYTNQDSEFDSYKVGTRLNDHASKKEQNDEFFFNPRENRFVTPASADGKTAAVTTRTAPSMRLNLNVEFFKNKILNAPAGSLTTNDVFINYFRGLYFKVEESGADKGALANINFAKGTITIKYKEDTSTTDKTKVEKTLVINMSGSTANLLEQTNTNANYNTATSNPNQSTGDERLYLKGGEGSLAVLNLFNPADNYSYEVLKNSNKEPIDENGNVIPLQSNGDPKSGYFLIYTKKNISNGVSDELEDIRYPLIDDTPGQIYHSIKRRWLINQANLVLNVDADNTEFKKSYEPNRIYLYDYTNDTTVLDYYLAAATNDKNTSKYAFGGFLTNDATTKRGASYKINLTNHIRNLIINSDAKNVKLAVVVTEDINVADFYKLKTSSGLFTQAPKASVMNPLGTILYGTGATSTNLPENKKIKLEIYYTKTN